MIKTIIKHYNISISIDITDSRYYQLKFRSKIIRIPLYVVFDSRHRREL